MQLIRLILRFGYAPILLLGANGAAIYAIDRGDAGPTLGLLLLGAITFSFLAEQWLPYDAEWNRSRGDRGRDVAHAIVNEGATFAGLLLLPTLTHSIPSRTLWPSDWPLAIQVLCALFVLDAGISLAHFASHRIPLLWRFHAVHHSVERLYGLNGLMKHPIHQSIEIAAGTLPLIALGLPENVALALVFAVVIQLLLQHANVDYTVGPFRGWLATAEVHRFHHQRAAALGDVNFGLFTTLWDRLLGRFHDAPRPRFTSDELGIEGRPDYPRRYLAQLVEPFRPESTPAPAPPAAAV